MTKPEKTKAAAAAATAAAGVPRMGLSIAEFCGTFGVSQSHYRNLRRQKRGPKEIRLGRRVIITVRDAQEWARTQAA